MANTLPGTGGGVTGTGEHSGDQSVVDFLRSLRQSFDEGLLEFARLAGGAAGGASAKAHNTIAFAGTTSPFKLTWTPDTDFYIVGCTTQAGMAISTNPSYANFAAIIAVNGPISDVLLLFPVSSSTTASMGDCQIPIFKKVPLYIYGNVAGSFQIFLQPQ